jgi:hypothetical protein
MTLSLVRRAISVETELASTVLGISFEADTYYTMRTRLLGQGLFAKVWKSSDSEPANWQVWATDTQLTAPGGIGMATYSPPGATYPFSFTWDDLDTDEITGSAAYSPTILAFSAVNAAAITATGTGAATDMSVAMAAPIAAAAGTGDAYATTFDYQATIDIATGTGAVGELSLTTVGNAEAASGTGAAWQLTGSVSAGVAVSEGFGNAFNVADVTTDLGTTRPGWHSGTAVAVFVRGAAIDTPPHAVGRAAATRSRAQ